MLAGQLSFWAAADVSAAAGAVEDVALSRDGMPPARGLALAA
jgi:hypothetical protein